jgi:RNA recognition motif-containing protein
VARNYLVLKGRVSMRIYVGNLSYQAAEDDLRQAFEDFGQVDEVTIITDRETGRSRGFAFVEMPNSEEANAAIEKLNQQEHMGRSLRVSEAQSREQDRRGGGGRGSRRRGGGRDDW